VGRVSKKPNVKCEFRMAGEKIHVALAVTNSTVKRRKSGLVLMLVDQVVVLPNTAEWHGKPRHVKMVLKLYCKLSQSELRVIKRERAVQALAEGSPLLK
jgi:hypothetical protein